MMGISHPEGRDLHDRRYAEWLDARARQQRPLENRKAEDAEHMAADKLEAELALLIVATPATLPWMIGHKIEVLRHELTQNAFAGHPSTHEYLTMLAAIEADVIVFTQGWANGEE